MDNEEINPAQMASDFLSSLGPYHGLIRIDELLKEAYVKNDLIKLGIYYAVKVEFINLVTTGGDDETEPLTVTDRVNKFMRYNIFIFSKMLFFLLCLIILFVALIEQNKISFLQALACGFAALILHAFHLYFKKNNYAR